MCHLLGRTVCVDLPLLASPQWVRSQPRGPGCSGGEVAGLVFGVTRLQTKNCVFMFQHPLWMLFLRKKYVIKLVTPCRVRYVHLYSPLLLLWSITGSDQAVWGCFPGPSLVAAVDLIYGVSISAELMPFGLQNDPKIRSWNLKLT